MRWPLRSGRSADSKGLLQYSQILPANGWGFAALLPALAMLDDDYDYDYDYHYHYHYQITKASAPTFSFSHACLKESAARPIRPIGQGRFPYAHERQLHSLLLHDDRSSRRAATTTTTSLSDPCY